MECVSTEQSVIDFWRLIIMLIDSGAFAEAGMRETKASLGYLISLPACILTGFNVFGSGLFTAFGNGVVSGLLSLIRSFVILTCCLYGLTALFGGPGLWSAWPAAELLSILVTLYALKKYRGTYQY